ncbi:hypothetical protein FSO04_18590 [Paraburkholderia madseniana]|uniref:Uncharacterized protein n=1 Tax=Paraburkholderia madseniana TaxID=2599607 RepID=A0A6N6WCL8_9BURK|nr:hypothetical protein [Paraburkholderia madseniana]KAE8758405.1 hypothetical protein FSO04_18590 [Paraburkholderia madseniana]
MKIKCDMGFARLALYACITASLAACEHSAPSESDAKQAVTDTLGDCKYFELKGFKKTNGIPGDSGSDYRVEVHYTVRMSPDSDVKDYVKQWSTLYDRYQSMKADAEQKSNDYYSQKQAYVDANPNDLSAGQTFEAQHQDQYKPMMDEKIEVGNLASRLNLNSPGQFFRSRIVQTCPNVTLPFLSNFFRGKPTDLADDVDMEFTQTISMIKTDNGWQEAR